MKLTRKISEADIDGARQFHGHSCPGLAMGIRVAEIALSEIGPHAEDEEVVAIVETDMCAVDAIQYFTGCTFGKGNLIHLDYGKNVYTFICRSDGKAIRIKTRPDLSRTRSSEYEEVSAKVHRGEASEDDIQRYREFREQWIEFILSAPVKELFEVQEVEPLIPDRARLLDSVKCARCEEMVMETRARLFRGETYCIPCFEEQERRF